MSCLGEGLCQCHALMLVDADNHILGKHIRLTADLQSFGIVNKEFSV